MSARELLDMYGDAAGWDDAKKLALLCEFLDADDIDEPDLSGFLAHKLDENQLGKILARFR